MRSRQAMGFTLIELLIVVAIIAILAAIAVPNFLEAQVRAKVTRAKSDMRSLAMAEEAYRTDWDTYTFGQGGGGWQWESPGYNGFIWLTTPVAYITAAFVRDPFGLGLITAATQVRKFGFYEFAPGRAGFASGHNNVQTMINRGAFPADTYELNSDGPDMRDDTGSIPALRPGDYTDWSYPNEWNRNNVPAILSLIYDPTNGTVSIGEIFRTGGAVPPGPALQVFYGLGQR